MSHIAFYECYDSAHNRIIYKPKNDHAICLMDLLHIESFLTESQYEDVSDFMGKVGADVLAYEDPKEKMIG